MALTAKQGKGSRTASASRTLGMSLAIFAAASALYLVPAVETPFYTKGEAREALVVQSLHAGDGWLLPLRNGDEIPSKPPMFHWLAALAASVSGHVDETVVRIPSVVSAALVLAALASLVAGLYGAATALVAAGMLATMVTWVVAATAARVDMVFSAAVAVGLMAFFRAYHDGRRAMPQTFYACSAIAVLTKGPAGIILPAAVVLVYLACERDRPYFAKLRLRSAAPWIALAVAWYVGAYFSVGEAFVQKQLLEENFYRVVGAEAAGVGHTKPFYAHVPLLLAGIAPWTVAVPAAVAACWARRFEFRKGDPLRFFLIWFAVTLVLFSFAGSKRAVYLLPAYPAVAVLLGRWWVGGEVRAPDQTSRTERDWRMTWPCLAFVLAIPAFALFVQSVGIPIGDWIGPVMSDGDRANMTVVARYLESHPAGVAIVSGITLCAVACFVVLARKGRRVAAAATAITIAAMTIVLGSLAVQKEIARSQTVREFVGGLVVRLHNTPVYSFGRVDYPAVFYARQSIPQINSVFEAGDRVRFVVLAGELDEPLVRAQAEAGERRVSAIGRFTYDDNPRRDPLLALLVERVDPAGLPDP